MANLLQTSLGKVYKVLTEKTDNMLIITGALGWALSSAAQIAAIVTNKEISNEKKSFLIPQEFLDAAVNIAAFLGITLLASRGASKLVSTGKILPKSTREFLNKEYKTQVGKLDFNIDNVISKAPDKIQKNYSCFKNVFATGATLGATILSSNIVTPVVRNRLASGVQKTYIQQNQEYRPMRYSGDMRI